MQFRSPPMLTAQAQMRLAVVAAGAMLAAWPVAAQGPGLAMLGQLERGEWQLRERGSTAAPRTLCLGDARQFIQLRHERASCSRYTIEDTPEAVTVHYTCAGAGHGRTTIRRETNRLVQIDTQGIINGSPFSDEFEARRTGSCS